MKTTRTAVRIEDNDQIQAWARLASVEENRAVFSAEIINRLIENHKRNCGNEPPRETKGVG